MSLNKAYKTMLMAILLQVGYMQPALVELMLIEGLCQWSGLKGRILKERR